MLVGMSAAAPQKAGQKSTSSGLQINLTKPYNPLITNYNISPTVIRGQSIMGKLQRAHEKLIRQRLFDALGAKCAVCGIKKDLHLDCIEPRSNGHGTWDYGKRQRFYRTEYEAGNLQILCGYHNRVKGNGHLEYDHELPF